MYSSVDDEATDGKNYSVGGPGNWFWSGGRFVEWPGWSARHGCLCYRGDLVWDEDYKESSDVKRQFFAAWEEAFFWRQ